MKQLDALKLTFLAASVAGLGVGCASTGYARYDSNANTTGMGASASAQVGTDNDLNTRAAYHGSQSYEMNKKDEGAARITVSTLSFSPETRANWVNKFPFYDESWKLRTIDLYTFAVPAPNLEVAANDLPQFDVNLPPGSVFVESAGGAGEARTGLVIQHSPSPIH